MRNLLWFWILCFTLSHAFAGSMNSIQNVFTQGKTEVFKEFLSSYPPYLPDPNLMARGGGSSNGGGGGLLIEENSQKKIITNDFWESKRYGELVPVLGNESALEYILRVLETNISPLNQYFTHHLLTTLSDVLTAQWNSHETLPLLEDLGELIPVPPSTYRPVQIITRYSFSASGKKPQIYFDYVPEILAKLDVQNLAMILLHEAIYVLGSELKHQNSSKVRALVNLLLSTQPARRVIFNGVDLYSENIKTSFFNNELKELGFEDFTQLYLRDLEKLANSDLSSYRRIVYASYKNKSRGFNGGLDNLTPEESFYFFWNLVAGREIAKAREGMTIEEFILSSELESEEVKRVCHKVPAIEKGRESVILQIVLKKHFRSIKLYCKRTLGSFWFL